MEDGPRLGGPRLGGATLAISLAKQRLRGPVPPIR